MATTTLDTDDVPVALETPVPDLLRRHPEARPVLDRHGLRGCGGRLGPYESVRFFARAHGIGREARVVQGEQTLEGRIAGLSSRGELELDTVSGRRLIAAGDVFLSNAA